MSADAQRGCLSRRELLLRTTNGFGALACSALFGDAARAQDRSPVWNQSVQNQSARHHPVLHHPARAERVIFLYMDGGPSQVDTFDPKPRLAKEHGQPIAMKVPRTQFDNVGTVLQSPWKFTQHGECGTPVSELFPHVARHVDKLCVVRSMTSRFPEHTSANYFLHTGLGQQGRPSMGSWLCYGLGAKADDLPGFVVLNGGLVPPGGLENFGSGFLPASFQGSLFGAGETAVANLAPPGGDFERQRRKLDLIAQLDGFAVGQRGSEDAIESAIKNYELAFRMQRAVPEITALGGVSAATRALYGLDDDYELTRRYGTLCLYAKRLVQRGVRFVELTVPKNEHDRWDQHEDLLPGHGDNARMVDRPIAGLLEDLEQSGLLETTLVVWAGEFGRTPMAQGSTGRDHNPHGFSIWLAGGGAKPGAIVGATDDYGYFAIEGKAEIHDLHATMLHLLGLDHTRLTFRFSGRDMRLTDVHGEVQHAWLA